MNALRRASPLVAAGAVLLAGLAAVACCTRERTGTISGPGLTVDVDARRQREAEREAARARTEGADASTAITPAPTATFVDLTPGGATFHVRACEEVVVALASGNATVIAIGVAGGTHAPAALAPDDAFVGRGMTSVEVQGAGLALVAVVARAACDPRNVGPGALTTRVLAASAARELTWAGGGMHARLDSDGAADLDLYAGRLAGSAAVAPHAHEASWEILAAVEGGGTFVVDGKPAKLGPRTVVMVPKGVTHAFEPEPGAPLRAFQIYAPRGPEQRFKGLAATASGADAGSAAAPAPARDGSGRERDAGVR